MDISKVVWLEDIVEKLLWKHNVEEHEVIEALGNKPLFQRKEAGYKPGKMYMLLSGEPTAAVY